MDAPSGCSAEEGLRRLVLLFPRVARGLRRAVDTGGGTKLGGRHRPVLALVRQEPRTVGALAAALGLTLPSTSGLVADLEAAALVSRSPDPTDRRRTRVTIAKGRLADAERWLEGSTAPLLRALEHLTPEERLAFVRAMEHLDAELGGASTETGFPKG